MPCSVYVCNIYGNEAHSVGGRRRWTGFLVVSPMIGEMHASGREVSLVPQGILLKPPSPKKRNRTHPGLARGSGSGHV